MITVKRKIELGRTAHGQRRVATATPNTVDVKPGRVPRISHLMALAIRLDGMLRSGEVDDLTELARLSHVTQPRMTQILNLALLAPEIQEELLFLPRITSGKGKIHEKMLRPIAAEASWRKQRVLWEELRIGRNPVSRPPQ